MQFRKAEVGDIPKIMEIVAEAQAFLRSCGVVQWQNNYPSEELISSDIEKGIANLAVDGGETQGYFVLTIGPDPDYIKEIEGGWKTDVENYAVIHRVATTKKGKGIGGAILSQAIAMAKRWGVPSMRVDTHRDNIPMQSVLKNHGFEYCGIIWVEEGERFAFEALFGEK